MKGLVYCAPVRVVGSSSWHFNHYALLLQENIFLTHVHHPSIFVSSCQIVFDILEDILLCPFPIFDTLLFILIRYSNIFSKHTCALPLPPLNFLPPVIQIEIFNKLQRELTDYKRVLQNFSLLLLSLSYHLYNFVF